jgi:hypothetical protein
MERMFSKPFIAALEGHADAVEVLARRPNSITDVASASWDGGAFTEGRIHPHVTRPAYQKSFFTTLGGGPTLEKCRRASGEDIGPLLGRRQQAIELWCGQKY